MSAPEPSVNLISDFASHPDKWAAANKEHVAKSLGTTVAEIETRIAKATAALPEIMQASKLDIKDMPASCVPPGKIGDIIRNVMVPNGFCLAYSYLPIIVAAGAYVVSDRKPFLNLYAGVIGEPQTGKSQGDEWAKYLFGLDIKGCTSAESFGSVEGLIKVVGNQGGGPYIWSIDEMSHLFVKASYVGAAFFKVLNTLFYAKQYRTTGEKQKQMSMDASLSILGGMTPSTADDCFGADAVNGIYTRFLFAYQPTGFVFDYQGEPHELGIKRIVNEEQLGAFEAGAAGPAPQRLEFRAPRVTLEVYKEKSSLMKNEKINGRVLEICIRCARICGAWDGLTELTCSYMKPFWELARYQMKMRQLVRPNVGRNDDAACANVILDFLDNNYEIGKYLTVRDLLHKTHIERKFGPGVVQRVLKALDANETIDIFLEKSGGKGRPRKIVRLHTDVEEPVPVS